MTNYALIMLTAGLGIPVLAALNAGLLTYVLLLGQLFSAAAIDHFGLFGAQVSPLTLTRAAGVSVMALGV